MLNGKISHNMFDNVNNREMDRAPLEEAASVQLRLLQQHVGFATEFSPFYRRLLSSFHPDDINSHARFAALPFTCKSDLAENHADFLSVPERDIVDFCLTSGTTGKPVAMLQSNRDLERLGYNEEMSFRVTGITSDDRVLIAAAIDRCFMAGFAYLLGLNRIGATSVRGGSSNIAQLMELIRISRPTAVVGVPSLLLAVGERFLQQGTDPALLGIRKMICIGEPVRNQDLSLSPLGSRLSDCWNSHVFGTYASTEMATAFTDCEHGLGGHVRPDLIMVEIVSDDNRPLPTGEYGEVVVTPLQVTGMPLIRFKTGDISVLHDAPCPCGRTSARLGPIIGRKSQMLKFRGTTVYPPAISSVLQGVMGVVGYYVEVYSDFDLSDRIKVVVGATDSSLTAEYLADLISAAIRVTPEVSLATPEEVLGKTMQDNKRKPVTFFDYRTRQDI
jgi:phenylacetate-CoA ligase